VYNVDATCLLLLLLLLPTMLNRSYLICINGPTGLYFIGLFEHNYFFTVSDKCILTDINRAISFVTDRKSYVLRGLSGGEQSAGDALQKKNDGSIE